MYRGARSITRLISNKRAVTSGQANLVADQLKSAVSKFSKPNYYNYMESQYPVISKLGRASVLVAISSQSNSTYFTFSKRTEQMKSFAGHNCFVGGKRDDSDESDVYTAYREAKEEIGIDSSQLTLLAELCPILTYTGILITPVLAYYDKSKFEPKLNKDEVELIFDLPTDRFLSSKELTMHTLKSGHSEYSMHNFKNQIAGVNHQIDGITAFISIYVAALIHNKKPEFKLVPGMDLDPNYTKFLENFLIVYSKGLIDTLAKKLSK